MEQLENALRRRWAQLEDQPDGMQVLVAEVGASPDAWLTATLEAEQQQRLAGVQRQMVALLQGGCSRKELDAAADAAGKAAAEATLESEEEKQ